MVRALKFACEAAGMLSAAIAHWSVRLPNVASARQIAITGSQAGFSNSAPVDCVSINANVAGDINNY
jgi:hypothetical protein